MQLIIGTYTEELPHVRGKADGVLAVGFDAASGDFGAVRTLARVRNPSYVALSPDARHLYAVIEAGSFDGHEGGGVAAFARDVSTGELTRLNALPTNGNDPCHVLLDQARRLMFVANYGSGSVSVYPVKPDGRLGEPADQVRHTGSGPDPERQESAHAHMTAIDPVTGDVLVCDLGADTIFRYALDDGGRLAPRTPLKLTPGAGPRHLAFHPGGRHLFVANELDSTVTTFRRGTDGFETADVTPATPETAANAPAAIRVSPSGQHVLVSNRGHDSIAVFRFEAAAERLTLAGATAAEGETPRDFIFTPDGTKVIVASQDSDGLASYTFDDATGALRLRCQVTAPTPVCLALSYRALSSSVISETEDLASPKSIAVFES